MLICDRPTESLDNPTSGHVQIPALCSERARPVCPRAWAVSRTAPHSCKQHTQYHILISEEQESLSGNACRCCKIHAYSLLHFRWAHETVLCNTAVISILMALDNGSARGWMLMLLLLALSPHVEGSLWLYQPSACSLQKTSSEFE